MEIRRMRSGEGEAVSRLIRAAYGTTYFNHDLYHPRRIERLNREGRQISFVAVTEEGKVAGHYALECEPGMPVAEAGQAVVDPECRGRGLLGAMKDAALAEARRMGLDGVYADAVTVHKFTQKSNIDHGAALTCVDLGVSPATEHFFGIEHGTLKQRVTCLMYFMRLSATAQRTLNAPPEHHEAIGRIYANMGMRINFASPASPKGAGRLETQVVATAGVAHIRSVVNGGDTCNRVAAEKSRLVKNAGAEAVFLELPLSDPTTPEIATNLSQEGFAFAGVAPFFIPEGDLLRLVFLTRELSREQMEIEGAFADWLVGYALEDQRRARKHSTS